MRRIATVVLGVTPILSAFMVPAQAVPQDERCLVNRPLTTDLRLFCRQP